MFKNRDGSRGPRVKTPYIKTERHFHATGLTRLVLCKRQECVTRSTDRDMKFLLKFKFIIVLTSEGSKGW